MRYIIGALAVLLAIIGTTAVNSCYMSSVTDQAIAYVEESLAAGGSGDPDAALRTARMLDRYWNERRCYLESVLMHAELNDITVTISDFISAIETEDEDNFRANGRLLCIQLGHLAELEQPRIGNIL